MEDLENKKIHYTIEKDDYLALFFTDGSSLEIKGDNLEVKYIEEYFAVSE